MILKDDMRYLVWCGAETDLIFNKGIDLPGFASFPLLTLPDTRAILRDYALGQIDDAVAAGLGVILETNTWVANEDRAAPLGVTGEALAQVNRDAVALMVEARDMRPGAEVLISANVGPRGDGYTGGGAMNAEQSRVYHSAQIDAIAGTGVDLVSGYTITDTAEAIGIVYAAKNAGLPCVIALTVEQDGCLPDGTSLNEAISATDEATGTSPLYYMVNCAHPDHFSRTLTGNPRLQGAVVNASCCSHAELDEAEELDDGDPVQLGQLIAELVAANPAMRVLGGCCGTDARHMRAIASGIKRLEATE